MAVFRIVGRECLCPFEQAEVDAYRPNVRTIYIQYQPRQDEGYEAHIEAFSHLIVALRRCGLITEMLHPNAIEWMVDPYDESVKELLRSYLEMTRCNAKIVDIYKGKKVFVKSIFNDDEDEDGIVRAGVLNTD